MLNNRAEGGRAGVPLPESSYRLGNHGESELEGGLPNSCSMVCPGQSKDMSRSHLTWKELRKRVKNTLM